MGESSAHAGDTGISISLPAHKALERDQPEQQKLKLVKTKDYENIIIALSKDGHTTDAMRKKGIQNWWPGELSYFIVNSVVPKGDTVSYS